MKLLYVAGGHPLQEADDCLMWQKLGIDWFSTGYYSQSKKPGDLPYINHINDPHLMKLLQKCTGQLNPHDQPDAVIGKKNKQFTSHNIPNIWQFTSEFISNFDVVFFNHNIENIRANWKVIHRLGKKPKIVIKTFAMHSPIDEILLNDYRKHPSQIVWSVRNSPTEINKYPGDKYAGHDAIIRGSVVRDEYEVSGWRGTRKEVVTFANTFNCYPARENRRRNVYKQCRELSPYPFRLFGAGNEDDPLASGFMTHSQKIETLRNARVSLTTGTPGATNTYSFVEAWVMGLPQVVYGQPLWNSPCYEPDQLGTHEHDMFIADTPEAVVKYINMIMTDDDLANQLSINSRANALKVYGRDVLVEQWKEFLFTTIQTPRYVPTGPLQNTKHVHHIKG